MIKKTITYKDYNGQERTEDFYFNFSKAEVLEKELSTEGGYYDYLQKIINAKDQKQLIDTFKDIVLRSYGEKSEDGRRFIKTPEIQKAFSETEAYSEIFMELALDEDAAAKFVNGIYPSDLESIINEAAAKRKKSEEKKNKKADE